MLDPRQLFRLLHEEEVAAVLVGGVALIVQGVTHFTNDIDLCYRRDDENVERLVRALTPVHPRLRVEGLSDEQARALPFQFDARTLRATEMLTLRTDIGDVDLLGQISGLGNYTQLEPYIEELEIDGIAIPVLSLDGLLATKRAAGRGKDLTSLPHIEAAIHLRASREEV